jgi:excinuclease ABC subunit C
MSALEDKVKSLPLAPGVYLFHDDQGKVIYIGKARVLRQRVKQYFQEGSDGRYQFESLVKRIADVEVITTDSELEALILESNLVRDRKPRYNIDLRDDKSFPFLRITNESFPRVFLTRHPVMDGSRYFGPFSDLFHLRGLLRVLRSMLRIRTCNLPLSDEGIAQNKFKACLEFHIGRCNAPCIAHESREQYASRIQDFQAVASGKSTDAIDRLRLEMDRLAEDLQFEQAAQLRDWLSALDQLRQRQKMITPEPVNRDIFGFALEDDGGCVVIFQVRGGRMLGRLHYRLKQVGAKSAEEVLESAVERYYSEPVSMPDEIFLPIELPQTDLLKEWLKRQSGNRIDLRFPERGEKAQLVDLAMRNAEMLLAEQKAAQQAKEKIPASLKELQSHLHLPILPKSIAAFDISTLQGTDKVASMVVFENGRAARSQYRRFKIRTVEGLDDFASMKEAVLRRFSRLKSEEIPFPDLLLIDGGKGQLSAAVDALRSLQIDQQPILGLAKRLEEIFLPGESLPHYLPRTSSALKLLQQIRDEAHRFAITYHRQVRGRRSLLSTLEEIDGIGPARRKALLSHFGSMRALKSADLAQIEMVKGMTKPLAVRVLQYLKDSQQHEQS